MLGLIIVCGGLGSSLGSIGVLGLRLPNLCAASLAADFLLTSGPLSVSELSP